MGCKGEGGVVGMVKNDGNRGVMMEGVEGNGLEVERLGRGVKR